jgi:hypothetical protein
MSLRPHPVSAGAGIAVAAASAGAALGRPLHHDEASAFFAAGGTLSHLARETLADLHPPLWFVGAHAWFAAGGSVESLRLVSALTMGTAVAVALEALRRALAPERAIVHRLAAAFAATSPLLAFAGGFARYYAFVALLVACAAALLGAASRREGTARARCVVALGGVVGLLGITHYASAALAGGLAVAALLPRWWRDRAAGEAALFAAAVLPCAGLAGILFWLQVESGGVNRLGGGAVAIVRDAVASAAVLTYAFAVGDAVPPWLFFGIPFAAWSALLTARALAGLRGEDRGWIAGAAVLLAMAALVGGATFRGAGVLFLPPRLAFVAFAWVLLAAFGSARAQRPWRAAAPALAGGAIGIAMMLFTAQTTSWSYRMPLGDIVRIVREEEERHPGQVAVVLPERSMANVRLAIAREFPDMPIGRIVDATEVAVTVEETRDFGSQWNLLPLIGAGASPWQEESRYRLLEEPAPVVAIKERIARRRVAKEKLVVLVLRRHHAPGSPVRM